MDRPDGDHPEALTTTIEVAAPRSAVWEAWTTREGACTFFAPECHIEAIPGGTYEVYFSPEAAVGRRGAEGTRVLAIDPEHMLSFTWNFPERFDTLADQRTVVIVRLDPPVAARTRVTLTQVGWGHGEPWDGARAYFEEAWDGVVLPRLRRRFEAGPIDWAAES